MPLDTTLAATYSLTPRVKQLLLRVEGHTFSHARGQHVSVRVETDDGRPVYRPYSPVSGPGTDTLVLAVKRYDDGTCSVWLHEREVGDVVPITDPSGNLRLHSPDRDVAFLATGTGLTPMLAMLPQYLDEGTGRAVLLFGERSEQDLMYRAALDGLAASHARLSVEYVLSDPPSGWTGPSGYVQDHLGPALADLDHPHVYACGVPEMVVETTAALREEGIPEDDIFSEGWEEGAVDD
jgi:ferredoxin-NADP reductase